MYLLTRSFDVWTHLLGGDSLFAQLQTGSLQRPSFPDLGARDLRTRVGRRLHVVVLTGIPMKSRGLLVLLISVHRRKWSTSYRITESVSSTTKFGQNSFNLLDIHPNS
jgi:hypothetical protein